MRPTGGEINPPVGYIIDTGGLMAQTATQSLDAEEAVIGSILVNPESISEIIDYLLPDDLVDKACKELYTVATDLAIRGDKVDQISVVAEVNRRGNVTGMPAYTSKLIANCPTSLDIKHHAGIVKRYAMYRMLLDTSHKIESIAIQQDPNLQSSIDKAQSLMDEIMARASNNSRRLIVTNPRLIQTNPPRYIWYVNGKDIRLTLNEITQWGKFKNRIISELNFVPIKPKDWEGLINSLITHSSEIGAPSDASEEQQLKITIQKWFDRMREATVYSDLSVGRHVIREVDNKTCYFFQSTPLIQFLQKEFKRNTNPEDLWVLIHKWGGVRYQIRVPTADGSMPAKLWGLPVDFTEDKKQTLQPQLVPDDF